MDEADNHKRALIKVRLKHFLRVVCLWLIPIFFVVTVWAFVTAGVEGPDTKILVGNVSWILGIILLGVFAWTWPTNKQSQSPRHWLGSTALIAALSCAALIRILHLKDFGLFLDEFFWLESAERILRGESNSIFGAIGDQPSNFHAGLISLLLWLTGDPFLAVRLPGIFFSLCTLYFGFRWAEDNLGGRVPYIFLIFFTVSAWDQNNSVYGWHIVNSVAPITIAMLHFSCRVYRLNNPRDWFALSFLLGLAVTLGYSSIVMIIPISIALLATAWRYSRSAVAKDFWFRFSYFIFALCLMVSATATKVLVRPSAYRHESVLSATLSDISTRGLYKYLLRETAGIIESLTPGSALPNVVGPRGITLSEALIYLCLIGLVVTIARIRSLWSITFIATFIVYGAVFMLFTPHQYYRESYLIPLFHLLGALGVEGFYKFTTQLFSLVNARSIVTPSLITCAAVILVVIGERNTSKIIQGSIPGQYGILRESHCWALTDYIQARATPGSPVLVPADSLCHPIAKAALRDSFLFKDYSEPEELNTILSHYSSQQPVVMFMVHDKNSYGYQHGRADQLQSVVTNNGFKINALLKTKDKQSFVASRR